MFSKKLPKKHRVLKVKDIPNIDNEIYVQVTCERNKLETSPSMGEWVDEFVFLVRRKKSNLIIKVIDSKKKSKILGLTEISIESLIRSEDVIEQEYNLQPKGKIRLKLYLEVSQLKETLEKREIDWRKKFPELMNLLCEDQFQLSKGLFDVINENDSDKCADTITRMMVYAGCSIQFVKILLEREINESESPDQVFSYSSMAVKASVSLSVCCGIDFMKKHLLKIIKSSIKNTISAEDLSQKFFLKIQKLLLKSSKLSDLYKSIYSLSYKALKKKFPNEITILSKLIFALFIPFIVSPSTYFFIDNINLEKLRTCSKLLIKENLEIIDINYNPHIRKFEPDIIPILFSDMVRIHKYLNKYIDKITALIYDPSSNISHEDALLSFISAQDPSAKLVLLLLEFHPPPKTKHLHRISSNELLKRKAIHIIRDEEIDESKSLNRDFPSHEILIPEDICNLSKKLVELSLKISKNWSINTEIYQEFLKNVALLKGVDLKLMNFSQLYSFWINICNTLSTHAICINGGIPKSRFLLKKLQKEAQYKIGNFNLSIEAIREGIIKGVPKYFRDERCLLSLTNHSICSEFCLTNFYINEPCLFIFHHDKIDLELITATKQYIDSYCQIKNKTLHIPTFFKWIMPKSKINNFIESILKLFNEKIDLSNHNLIFRDPLKKILINELDINIKNDVIYSTDFSLFGNPKLLTNSKRRLKKRLSSRTSSPWRK